MNKKNLLLICASGITTGLLVRNMEKEIEYKDLPVYVYSSPSILVQQILRERKIDGILIGPHIEYEIENLRELLDDYNIPYGIIGKDEYELIDGSKVLDKGLEILGLEA